MFRGRGSDAKAAGRHFVRPDADRDQPPSERVEVRPAVAPTNLVALRPQPEGVPWPTLAWPTGPLPDGAADRLDRALALVGTQDPKLGETRAVVVIHHGRLVAERFAPGFGPDTPLLSWSMAKSVTQALLGIAVRKGLVDIGSGMWKADAITMGEVAADLDVL